MRCLRKSNYPAKGGLRSGVRSKLCFLAAILLFTISSNAHADIYRYRDETGRWHFSNAPVDPRYQIYIRTYSETPDSVAQEQIKRAQMLLGKLGYTPGPSDGVMGVRTSQAIKAFNAILDYR